MLKRLSKTLPLLLIVLVLAVGVACQKTEALSADQVVANAVAAQPDVKSLRLSLNMTADIEGSIEGEAAEGSVTLSGTATIDQENQGMQAQFDLLADVTGADPMSIDSGAQMYLMNGYLYFKADIADILEMTDMGDMAGGFDLSQMWLKLAISDNMSASLPSMEDVTGIIESAQVEMVKEEKVGGVNCYVLSVTPDFEAIQQGLAANPLTAQMNIQFPDMEGLISNMSFKVWVAKDSYFLVKTEVVIAMEMNSAALGDPEGEDYMNVNLTFTLEASDYNKVGGIELPAEAQSALDLTSFINL